MTQAFNNLIKFPLTPEFISYWGQSAIAPRIKNNYLELRIARADYTLVTSGEGVSTKKGYSSVYGEKERKIIGFRARVRSQSEDLYLAMIELANYTAGSDCNLVPIDVIDHVYFHNRTDRSRGYRIRKGVFEGEFSQVEGAVTQGYIGCDGNEIAVGNRYSSGFSFKFMEVATAGYF